MAEKQTEAHIKTLEQAHLTKTLDQIETKRTQLAQKLKQVKADEQDINAHFNEDVHLSVGSDTTTIETALSIRQQQQMLQERESHRLQTSRQLTTLAKLQQRPYFARVDFRERGEGKQESLYIGLASFLDEQDRFVIYDWRAPISSIYYEGKLGQVSYATPDGEQTVDLELKRQFLIEHGRLVSVFDTAENIGDQMLLEVLGHKSSPQMKAIVTTIQQEQNKIIRNTEADLLFVQGAAGSGKTSAVLQRIAFLLYQYRGKLSSSQVIMFSPNQLFNDYIDNVLPELGEQNMVQMTYDQFVQRRVPQLTVEDNRHDLGQQLTANQLAVERLTTSLAFFKALGRYARHLEQEGVRFKELKFRGRPLFAREKIADIYYSFNENYHLRNRVEATQEQLVALLNRRIEPEIKKKWVSDLVESLSQEQLQALYATAGQEFSSSEAEFHYLARKLVVQALTPIQRRIQRMQFFNTRAQYLDFLKHIPQLVDLSAWQLTDAIWQEHVQTVQTQLQTKHLAAQDLSPYLYLVDLMTGKRGDRSIKFVFIDEVQDYTPFDLAYLTYQFPRARYTMLGDLNQAIFSHDEAPQLLTQIQQLFDHKKITVAQLTQSYRSTTQITEFTRAILRNGQKIVPFERTGPLPEVVITATHDQALQTLISTVTTNQQDQLTTAIVAQTPAASDQLYQELRAQGMTVTLIRSGNQRLAAGTLIVPAYLAKGLEFDAVIMWQADRNHYASNSQRQLVYTITSRAMHRLTVIAEDTLSPLLTESAAHYAHVQHLA